MATSVPKRIATTGLEGLAIFKDFSGPSTPNVLQTPINETVPVGKIWNIHQVYVVCSVESEFYIKKNGVIIGSGRTGPANSTGFFSWVPSRAIPAGESIKIEFMSLAGTPIRPIEAYLHASEVDA